VAPVVSIIVATHDKPDALSICLTSLKLQTYGDFECIVVHEPSERMRDSARVVDRLEDARFTFRPYSEDVNDFGVTVKVWALQFTKGSIIAHVNGDCYYTPVYLERMVAPILSGHAAFAYCDWVSHHIGYEVLNAEPRQNAIDSAGWLCRRDVVERTPWPQEQRRGPAPDGWYVVQLVKSATPIKVPGVLWVHC
jgi:hypothetical protein